MPNAKAKPTKPDKNNQVKTKPHTMTQPQFKAKIPTMSITVQFFASLREQVGKQQASLPFEAPLDVSTVWTQSTDNMEMPANTLCAVNMEYVKADATVSDGDEVAFFPPVTGG